MLFPDADIVKMKARDELYLLRGHADKKPCGQIMHNDRLFVFAFRKIFFDLLFEFHVSRHLNEDINVSAPFHQIHRLCCGEDAFGYRKLYALSLFIDVSYTDNLHVCILKEFFQKRGPCPSSPDETDLYLISHATPPDYFLKDYSFLKGKSKQICSTGKNYRSLKAVHAAHLMNLRLFPVAPDIAKLQRTARRQRYLCPFAVGAVPDLHAWQRHEAVHLAVLRHLDLPFSAPDGPG
jgi:hypothetical protein